MAALLALHRLDGSVIESVNDLAQVEQIAEPAEIVGTTSIVRRRSPCLLGVPIGPVGRNSAKRLPSGKTTRTRRTPRRRILLITASDWPSKAWRSRVIVSELEYHGDGVVCGRFLRKHSAYRTSNVGSAPDC